VPPFKANKNEQDGEGASRELACLNALCKPIHFPSLIVLQHRDLETVKLGELHSRKSPCSHTQTSMLILNEWNFT
jgi:hypothetical protein